MEKGLKKRSRALHPGLHGRLHSLPSEGLLPPSWWVQGQCWAEQSDFLMEINCTQLVEPPHPF
eukprot:3080659-Amphidinium_carterae.2